MTNLISVIKTILLLLVLCSNLGLDAQGVIIVKKKRKSIQYFWEGSQITFQMTDKQWITGTITRITPDSFYFTQEIIRYYMMGTDTLHFGGFGFAYTDVYALPTKKQMISFENDQVKVIAGHESFVWVKNGAIFQLAGGGYVVLNLANSLYHKDPPFAKENLPGLAVGTGVFLLGQILHWRYYPYWKIGKRYRLVYMSLTPGDKTKPTKPY